MAINLASLAPVVISSGGVAVPLTASTLWVTSVTVQAELANVGNLYIGGSSVTPTNGVFVSAGESIEISADDINGRAEEFDLSLIYINASSASNGARVLVFKRAN